MPCPDSAYGYSALGTAFPLNQQADTAIYYYNIAISKDSSYYRAYSSRGTAYLLKEIPDKAEADYKKALKLKFNDLSTMISLASLRASLNDINGAMDYFRQAEDIDAKYIDIYWNRGALNLSLNRFYDALKDVNKAISLEPNNPKGFFFRGTVERYLKKYDEAMKDYNEALRLNPLEGEAYVRRGILYGDMGEYKKAIDDMDKGYKLRPDLIEPTKTFYDEAKSKAK
jgi:Tfp pilus assembly protein PilF